MFMGAAPVEESEGVVAEINITPLTDIFLVLLIIFMVTSSVIVSKAAVVGRRPSATSGAQQDSGVRVKASGQQGDGGASDEPLLIQLGKKGEVSVAGQKMSPLELQNRLRLWQQEHPHQPVVVKAPSGIRHGKVMDVLETAEQAGIQRISVSRDTK